MKDCSACVCYNDELAHLLTTRAQAAGIRIPQDLSLVSVDNSELARLNAVPLTSVAHPHDVLGVKAAENMLGLITDPGGDATFEFEGEIESRRSVVPYNTTQKEKESKT